MTRADEAVLKDGNLPNKPGVTNWVEEAGGLPPYIRRVAEDLHTERGMSVSHAIATAVNRIKKWSRGGGDVKPDTQAKAAAALAQWTAMKKDAGMPPTADDHDLADVIAKGLNYMEKPHRYTPGPAGACLFCSNSQRWHTEHRPKTPAEVEQEKKDRATQEKNDLALASARMLTKLPTEDDMLAMQTEEQKRQATAAKIAGAPLQDENDPLVAAGVKKAHLVRALATVMAKKAAAAPTDAPTADKPTADADAPLVEIQYDPNKQAGGLSEPERKQHADDGVAMEDGTFPIADADDLKVALQLWGKADDPHAARDHIIARAYDLDLLDMLSQNLKDYDEKANGATPSTDATETKKNLAETIAKYAVTQPRGPDGRWIKQAVLDFFRREFNRVFPNGFTGDNNGDTTGDFRPSAHLYAKSAYAVTKATAEKRYTLGPMYIPDRLDAHNEFATADELQKAVWDYVRSGDRAIRLQHNVDIIAGECVEVLSWPTDITANMALPSPALNLAKSAPVTFPAGTTYMGIVWEPWAWEWVKKGKISGLSMGGFAKRVTVDLGDEVNKSLDADPIVQAALAKYSASQPRARDGKWTDSAASLTPTSLPTVTGIISGQREGEFVNTGTTYTANGTPINHLTHLGLDPTTKETGRSDLFAVASGLTTFATHLGISVEHLLDSLQRMLVRKHGQKGEPGYPHKPRSAAGGTAIGDKGTPSRGTGRTGRTATSLTTPRSPRTNSLPSGPYQRQQRNKWTPTTGLDAHLVDYLPTRRVNSEKDARAITDYIPGAKSVPYTESPFFKMLTRIGLKKPTANSDPKKHEAERNEFFDRIREETVDIDSLTFTQPAVNEAAIERAIARGGRRGSGGVYVARKDGKNYLIDGHHGVVAASAMGEKTIKARVLDLDLAEKGDEFAVPVPKSGRMNRATGLPYVDGDPRNDPSYEADYDEAMTRIDAAYDAGLAAEKRWGTEVQVDGKREIKWDADRAKAHQMIVDEWFRSADERGVKRDKQMVMMAGRPGGGKTTLLKDPDFAGEMGITGVSDNGSETTSHIVVNPDALKDKILAGTYPDGRPLINMEKDFPGLSEGEIMTLIHEESASLAKLITKRAFDNEYNMIIDESLADREKAQEKYVTPGFDMGYHISIGLVDIPVGTSMHRAGFRHKKVKNGKRTYTGRLMPLDNIPHGDPVATYEALVATHWISGRAIRVDPSGKRTVTL